jgi:hypothetical protein
MPALSTAINTKNIERVQAQLAANLAHLCAQYEGLTDDQAAWRPDKGEWSLLELLAHLRSSADLNQFRIFAMLAVNQPALPAIHPRLEWQLIVPYARLSLHKSLAACRLQREELLITLAALDEAGWSRAGTWDGRRYSIYQVARSMALHEAEHFEQMGRLIAGPGQGSG